MVRIFAIRAATLVAPLVALLSLSSLGGCGTMTPQQAQAVEVRRFCEANPHSVERCVGFLGDH